MSANRYRLTLRILVATCVSLSFFAVPAAAQSIAGSITGSVRDSSNSAIMGAHVTLVEVATNAERRATSSNQGDFVFTVVGPGSYRLMVQFQGFQTLERDSIQLAASDRLALGNLVLQVGSSEQKITVTAEGANVQTASAEHSAMITNSQVNTLLVRGRNVTSLMRLLPGVVDTAEGASGQASGNSNSEENISKFFYFNVQGNRANANNITLDGISLNEPGGNTQVNVAVGLDSISEVKVLLSGYQAEYGRMSGANIQLIAKSGTRDFHGLASYYKRHEQFNANNYFNNQLGLPKPWYRFNTYNYNVGGPVYVPGKFNRNREKLFFFWSQEFWPLKVTNPLRQVTVPTALERTGDFSQSIDQNGALIAVTDPTTKQPFPGNRIPASRIDPNGQALSKIFPLPNFLDRNISAGRYNYISQISGETPNRVDTWKSDYNISPRDILSFTWSAHFRREEGYATRSSVSWPMNSVRIRSRSLFYAWHYQHIFSPGLVNELTVGANQHHGWDIIDPDQLATIQRKTFGLTAADLFPAANPLGLIPATAFGGVTNAATTAFGGNYPLDNNREIFNLADNLTKVAGSHTVKFGVLMERLWVNDGPTGKNASGLFDFSRDVNNPLDSGYAYGNAILGNFDKYQQGNVLASPAFRNNSVEWFVQDNWRVNRRLTLDYGARLYWLPPYTDANGQRSGFVPANFDPKKQVRLIQPALVNGKKVGVDPVTGGTFASASIGAIVPGSGDTSNGIVTAATNKAYPAALADGPGIKFAPRLGFAFDPFADGKSAVRGGFGIFYNKLPSGSYGGLSTQYPILITPTINFDTISTFANAPGLVYPQDVQGLARNLGTPMSMDLNLSVQRNLGFGTVVDLGYAGTLGRHMLWQRSLSTIPLGANFDPKNADPTNPKVPLSSAFLRPIVGYNNVGLLETASSSNYHSMQASVNRRFARTLQFGVNWTWSKAMDYNDSDTDSISTLVPVRVWNYGLASFDRTHALKFNWLYDLPSLKTSLAPVKFILSDWQWSGVASFVSGAPTTVGFTTTNGIDITGTASQGPRINVTGDPVLAKGDRTFYRNFDTSVFQLPAVGTFGNAARTLLRGPGINNWDVSLFKNFPVKERVKVQFRWEMYNALNHTQFSAFDTTARFDATGKQVNAGLGQFTVARNPRIMQFAVRATF
jgi:hypothetical protein